MRMNVWLIKASQFFCGFCWTVCHDSGKKHVMPDALSRLATVNVNLPPDLNHSELDVLFVYTATLVQLSTFLLRKIIRGYRMDELWKKILTQIDDNNHFLEK